MKGVICGALTALTLAASFLQAGCSREPVKLHILDAGSLVIPFGAVAEEYEKLHPDIDVLTEGHGSIQVIRHITEIHDEIDIAAVADYSLLPMLMYPAQMPDSSEHYADWTINFATNRLGLAYTPESACADEINADNWYEILSREDVVFGFSDPRFDACGYRSMMLIKLAEEYYGDPDIFKSLVVYNLQPRVKAVEENGVCTIKIPEEIASATDKFRLRGFSVQLIALLESRDIDYAFQYESVAVQHGLEFLALPPQIDLSDAAYTENYGKVRVVNDFQRFASVTPEFRGQPIVYGITIPANAPHREEAIEFLNFLLGPEGQRILLDNSQPVIQPTADNPDNLPPELRELIVSD